MAIFSRRTLQRLLNDAVQAGLPRQRAATLVATINEHSHAAIASEWELVAFATLSKLADIHYEPDLGGEARADLLIEDKKARFPQVLIEVASVSDHGLDETNPANDLFDAIVKAAGSEGVIPNRLTLRTRTGLPLGGGRRPLPSRAAIPVIVGRRVRPFLRKVYASPNSQHQLAIKEQTTQLELLYDPAQTCASLTYASNASPRDIRKNPLLNALKTKARQLKRSNHRGIAGILVCDAGCQLLSDQKFTARVCTELFRNRSSVSFVALMGVAGRSEPKNRRLRAELAVYANERAIHPMPTGFDDYLAEAIATLPAAHHTGGEARSNLRTTPGPLWGSLYGSWRGSQREYGLSLRTLQLLLGGKLDYQEFLSSHRLLDAPENAGIPNFPAGMLEAGYSIAETRIEKLPDQDDDWMILTFSSAPDPALAGLRLPPQLAV